MGCQEVKVNSFDDQLTAWLHSDGPNDAHVPTDDNAWASFVNRVGSVGLSGLILERAQETGVAIPESYRQVLQDRAASVAAANINALTQLESLVRAFNRAEIPVMLLKGAALNLKVYPRPDLRPMSDVDLLVRPADVGRTPEVLQRYGCTRGFDLIRDDFFPRFHYEMEWMTNSPRPVRIDLHARPLRPLRISRTMPDDALWHRARLVPIGDAEAHVPGDEEMVIHLAAHAAYHGFDRLIWLYDIKRFVDRAAQGIDWGRVADLSAGWRLSLPVSVALGRVNDCFGPVLEKEALTALQSQTATWQDRLVLRTAPGDAASPLRHVAVNLLCTPGLRFRLAYLKAMLSPGPNHLKELYPYRHPGWTGCAHAWRGMRAVRRLLAAPSGGP